MKQLRRLHYSIAMTLLTLLALAACGGVRYPRNYLLRLPPPVPPVQQSRQQLGPLAIREIRCPAYLCEGRIAYRPSPDEVAFYEYHRWAMNPRQAITRFLADSLRAQSLFQTVSMKEPGTEPAYLLSGDIRRLEEVDDGHDVRAVCAIYAQLVEISSGKVVWNSTASEAVPVKQRNVTGVVDGLSEATRVTVDRLIVSLTAALAAPGEQRRTGAGGGQSGR